MLSVIVDPSEWVQYAGERIRTLGEILEHYKRRLYFHIEIKARAKNLSQRTADLARGYGVADSVIITSFQKTRLEEVRAYAPELPAGWLVGEVTDPIVAQAQEVGLTVLCPRSWWRTCTRRAS